MSNSHDISLQSRRQFCAFACQAAAAAAAGSVIASCGGSSPTSPSSAPSLSQLSGTVSGRVVTVSVAAGGPLSSVGGAALISSSIGSFLASRTANDAITVLTATCTHEACTVSGFESATYVCPCHGSQFTTSGAVKQGPATAALRAFASTLANGTLTFTA